jgi:hypothetical protein
MWASWNGHEESARTLLEDGADVNAKDNVMNQIMIIMTIKKLLTIVMMMIMWR